MRSTLNVAVLCTMFLTLSVLISGCEKEPAYPNSLWQGVSNLPKDDSGNIRCPSWVCLPNDLPFASRWADLPNNAPNGVAVANGPLIFFAGGQEEADMYGSPYTQISIFNSETEKVETLLELSLGRARLSGVLAGDQVIFAGGQGANGYGQKFFSTVDLINKTNLTQTTAELSEARSYIASAATNETAFFAGGRTLSGYSRKLDIYNVSTSQWKAIDLPRERAYSTGFVIGTQFYIAGGLNSAEGNLKIIDVYNIENETWKTLEAPHTHFHASSFIFGGKVYIARGDGLSNGYVDILDTATLTWSSFSLSDSRFDIAIAAANDKVIFMGGNYSANMDIYNTLTGKIYSGKLNTGVSGLSAGTYKNKCLFSGYEFNQGWTTSIIWMIEL